MGYIQPGYRAAADRYPDGFQRRGTGLPPPWRPGRPANDNSPWRPSGPPANDNAPGRNRFAKPGAGASAAARGAMSRLGGRMFTGIGAAVAAAGALDFIFGQISAPENLEGSPPGWTKYRSNCVTGCFGVTYNKYAGRTSSPTNGTRCVACISFFNSSAIWGSSFGSVAQGRNWVGYIPKKSITTGECSDSWKRNPGTPDPTPEPAVDNGPGTQLWNNAGDPWILPASDPMPLPYIYPALDPLGQPIGEPVPLPKPLPVEWPLPNVDPINPQSPKRLEPRNNPRPVRNSSRPSARPATITRIDRGGNTQGPGDYFDRPRDNEKKVIASPLSSSLLGRIIGTVGEIGDVIEAFHDALPDHCKRHRAGIAFDAIAVVECFGHIDAKQALKNLVANEIDDTLYGRVGRLGARANREQGRVRGPRVGPAGKYFDGPSIGEQVADAIFGD